MRKSTIGMMVLVVLTLMARSFAQDYAFTLKGADVAFAERNYDVARGLYERAIREGASLDSDLPHARNLVTAYLNANPPETAKTIQWLQVVVRLDPQADGLRLQLCKLLMNAGDTGGAVQQYRQLMERHPQSSEFVLLLASALRQDGKSDAALRMLKETVERYPNMNTVRLEYARALNFAREFSEARRQFSKVLDYDPNDLIAQVGMAKSMSYDGDQEGALVEYDRILKAHPGLYDAMIGKAFALLWSGRMEEAREILQKGLARHPDDREVREALASLPKGSGTSRNLPPAIAIEPPVTSPGSTIETQGADTHPSAAVSLTMPPRSIAGPKPKNSRAAKSGKTAVTEAPVAVGESPTLPTSITSSSPMMYLYIAFGVLVVMLVLMGLKLRGVQKARRLEASAAAKAAGVEDFVAGHSRRLADLFAPINPPQASPEHVNPKVPTVLEPEAIEDVELPVFSEAMEFDMPICEPIMPLADVIPMAASIELPRPKAMAAVEPVFKAAGDPEVTVEARTVVDRRLSATEVLIVGGLASVVQLQLRWLGTQIHDFKPLLERDWSTAASKIGQSAPAIIILNSGSDDRWTSMRMFSWIVANHPELRRRVIAVTTADHYPGESDDLVVCEPIDSREWQQKVMAAIEASKREVNLASMAGVRFNPNLRGAAAF